MTLEEALEEASDELAMGPEADPVAVVMGLLASRRSMAKRLETMAQNATELGRKDAERIRALVDAWSQSWDCSRSPGHEAMHDAVEKSREFLRVGR